MTGPIAARLMVGADGRHSTVAAAIGAAEYHVSAPGRMPAWAYFEGVPDQPGRALLGRMGDLAYLASPTDGDLYMAAVTLNFAHQAERLATVIDEGAGGSDIDTAMQSWWRWRVRTPTKCTGSRA